MEPYNSSLWLMSGHGRVCTLSRSCSLAICVNIHPLHGGDAPAEGADSGKHQLLPRLQATFATNHRGSCTGHIDEVRRHGEFQNTHARRAALRGGRPLPSGCQPPMRVDFGRECALL